MLQTTEYKILRRLRGEGLGALVTPARMQDLASRAAIDQALSRLARAGKLQRLSRGVYLYPKHHPVLGVLAPPVEDVAKLIAERDHIRLQPSGAYAANLLGLSEQVPAKAVFLTDGASRNLEIGGMHIELRRTTPKNMATAGRLSGLLIQALRNLGKEQVTQAHLGHLKSTLPSSERQALLKDLGLAPAWMQPLLRELAEA